jgi:hypothetical protein
MVRSISAARPISGSILPSRAFLVEVDAVGVQGLAALAHHLLRLGVVVGALDGAGLFVEPLALAMPWLM